MLIAHIAVVFVVKWVFSGLDLFSLILGTSISSFDAVPPLLGLRPESYHCGSIFHSVWTPLLGAVLLYPLGQTISLSFLVGGLLHLISDSVDVTGRPWLYPLTKRAFGLALLPHEFKAYLSKPVSITLEVISGMFVMFYWIAVGVDQASVLLILILIPFFVAFAIHHGRTNLGRR